MGLDLQDLFLFIASSFLFLRQTHTTASPMAESKIKTIIKPFGCGQQTHWAQLLTSEETNSRTVEDKRRTSLVWDTPPAQSTISQSSFPQLCQLSHHVFHFAALSPLLKKQKTNTVTSNFWHFPCPASLINWPNCQGGSMEAGPRCRSLRIADKRVLF